MLKKINIILLILIVVGISNLLYTFIYNTDTSIYKSNSTSFDSNYVSIFIQDDTGNYIESTDNTFPFSTMELNLEESYCLHGSTISYDSITKSLSMGIDKTDKCYLYFDEPTGGTLVDLIYKTNSTSYEEVVLKGDANYFTQPSSEIFNELYSIDDDYTSTGLKSVYFRGASNNNWVKFAGFYWRIVRITGEKGVKLIYSGNVDPVAGNESVMTGTQTEIGKSAYNDEQALAEYTGYMYSINNQRGYGISSTIKEYVDEWYEDNILAFAYEQYISNTIYCSDRNSYSSTGDYLSSTSVSTAYGYGTSTQYFSAYFRHYSKKSTMEPTIICSHKNDSFTISGSTVGNGALKYPVALLSADEMALIGVNYGWYANHIYIYNNLTYWSMSPSNYSSGIANSYYVRSGGDFMSGMGESANSSNSIINQQGVRPSITLKSDTLVSGTGTWDDPFEVIG